MSNPPINLTNHPMGNGDDIKTLNTDHNSTTHKYPPGTDKLLHSTLIPLVLPPLCGGDTFNETLGKSCKIAGNKKYRYTISVSALQFNLFKNICKYLP